MGTEVRRSSQVHDAPCGDGTEGDEQKMRPSPSPAGMPAPARRHASDGWPVHRHRERMSAHTLRQRLRRQRRQVVNDPLTRTAMPLLINIGSNGILGVAYWLVAARLYDTATVASNSAVIAAMTTLSGITQLNLSQTLPVFVPRARNRARHIIAQVYGAVTVFALLVLAVFIFVVLPHFDALSQALSPKGHLALFAAGLIVFNLFAMQDAALISLRKQKLIPVENAVFGSLKLLLLFPLLILLPSFGIFASWVIPLAILVPVISLVIFRRRPEEVTTAPATLPDKSLSTL